MHTTLLRAFSISILLLASNPSFAATVSFTGSFTGSALMYNPATDLSPSNGYNPPGNLGGYDGLITLNGFNTTLGTLNSVTLTTLASGSLEFKDAINSFGATTNTLNATLFMSGESPFGGLNTSLPFTFTSSGHAPGAVFDTGVKMAVSGQALSQAMYRDRLRHFMPIYFMCRF